MGSANSRVFEQVDSVKYVIGDESERPSELQEVKSHTPTLPGAGGGGGGKYNDQTILQSSHENVQRTPPRGLWWTQAALLTLACLLILSAGLRCATDEECSVLNHPSLGNLLNNTDTSTITVSAVTTLVAVHYVQMVATYYMVRSHSNGAGIMLLLVSIGFYVSVFAAFLYPLWYIAIVPVGLSGLLFALALHGLRRYYEYKPTRQRIVFFIACFLFAVYILSTGIYLVFSIIPSPVQASDFTGKQEGVFAAELTMLISGLLFMGLLAFFTRRVSYMFQVEKTVESYIEV
jgi:hypothetical protein